MSGSTHAVRTASGRGNTALAMSTVSLQETAARHGINYNNGSASCHSHAAGPT